MTQPLAFVTTNSLKFQAASECFTISNIALEQRPMDLQEIQSKSGKEIVLHKAAQAFKVLQRPIIVSDDTWSIPGLGGFPGPYMKDVTSWLNAEDFLRLTLPLEDRRIILSQHAAYQDENGQHYFVEDIVAILLTEVKGSSKITPHTTIVSFDGGQHSSAEIIATGQTSLVAGTKTVWDKVSYWLKSHEDERH